MEKPAGSLISFMANKVKSQGGINLAQGIPAFDPPAELLKILEQTSADKFHQYAPGTGNYLLLGQLEKHYSVPQKQFLVVNGATEAISLLFIYLSKIIAGHFTVLSFDPVYESYKNLPRIFNKPFITIPYTESGTVNFDELEQIIKAKNVKLILLASPGNPLGKIWSKHEVHQLINLCTSLKTYVVFDAVYSDLYFNQKPYLPYDKINEFVFYVNAFSKRFSITGWRVGYLIADNMHMPALCDIHDYTGLCAPSVLQQALAIYIDRFNFGQEYITDLREKLSSNYQQLTHELKNLGFSIKLAEGGYFVWAQLPLKFDDGLDYALQLYEREKVAVVPGIHFSEIGKNYVRFNIARQPYEISMAVSKIRKFMAIV